MLIIEHRINEASKLKMVPSSHGVELDLRSNLTEIYLAHDAFTPGELFSDWLQVWAGQFLILNVKEEGLENRILEMLVKHEVKNYFFLDQSFPFMQRLVRTGNMNTAARISDLESAETAMRSGAKWVWLDCFSGDWSYLREVLPRLAKTSIHTCLVSPELQRADDNIVETQALKAILSETRVQIDAVCTKKPTIWENFEN